ncbi:MAG: ABC transporter ATP-binding protein [Bacilli bacterium]
MKNAFEISNLEYQYPKSHNKTINNISFVVEEGSIFGILGPSGAGKSTTQKILTKLITGYSGEILYMGKNLQSYKKDFYETIGVGFEMPVHFNKLTAVENLSYFASLYHTNIDYLALLKTVGLYDSKDMEVGQFSKGMKVRLNFVRAMLNDPKVLFLDEPTNGLDPKNAKIIKELILDFQKRGGTVVITTHLMGDVEQLCDQVVFMTNGKLSNMSSPRDLKLKYGKKEVQVEYLNAHQLEKKTFPMQDLGHNEAFLHILNHENIETIHSGETPLEEIFILVTGEKANETND